MLKKRGKNIYSVVESFERDCFRDPEGYFAGKRAKNAQTTSEALSAYGLDLKLTPTMPYK